MNDRILVTKLNCIEKDGSLYTTASSWKMIRIFVDCFKNPELLCKINNDSTNTYNTMIPSDLTVHKYDGTDCGGGIQRVWKKRLFKKKLCKIAQGIDAVYIRMPDWDNYYLFEVAIRKRIKILSSIHGDWSEVYKALSRSSKNIIKKYIYRYLSYKTEYMANNVAKHSVGCFCVGHALLMKYQTFNKNSYVFANYLHESDNISLFNDRCNDKKIKILFVGRLEERKGIVYLIDALKQINEEGIIDIWLDIVGDGPEKQYLYEYSIRIGIIQKIKFHGYINYGSQLFSKYAESDIFILPSIAGEGCPKVIVEAMCRSVPVIGTNVGSIPYMIDTFKNGIIIKPGKTDEIVFAIKKIIEDKKLREKIIKGGISYSKANSIDKQRANIRRRLTELMPNYIW